ncbi:MAG: hypothetical protein C5B59_08690 [Bacteroidetes bacterium]|nr:MAG: hypothetical protein C5B59_08690 [Bacteroidota bacterium]
MANPSPQHTPTDGLGVAAYVQVTGTNVVNNSGGAGSAQGTTGFPLGQGIGAAPSSNHPVAQYALTLSLSAATVNGVAYAATCQLTTVLKDVSNTTYTPVGTPVYRSYGDPANKAASAPAWYNPSNFTGYDPNVASVSSSGLITSRHVGQTIVEVAFPTFDNTLGNDPNASGDAGMAGEPKNFIYAQIVVYVIA